MFDMLPVTHLNSHKVDQVGKKGSLLSVSSRPPSETAESSRAASFLAFPGWGIDPFYLRLVSFVTVKASGGSLFLRCRKQLLGNAFNLDSSTQRESFDGNG